MLRTLTMYIWLMVMALMSMAIRALWAVRSVLAPTSPSLHPLDREPQVAKTAPIVRGAPKSNWPQARGPPAGRTRGGLGIGLSLALLGSLFSFGATLEVAPHLVSPRRLPKYGASPFGESARRGSGPRPQGRGGDPPFHFLGA